MTKKYELTTETKDIDGHTVYRIKALKSFDTIIGRMVDEGDLGGWVESEKNLSQDGTCWLFDDAVGYENSRRSENSVGYDNSQQFGNSRQSGNSQQFGNSRQSGNSRQFGYSMQYDNSQQYGNSRQYGYSWQFGNSRQYGDSWQSGNSMQFGDSRQFGDSVQCGGSQHCTGDDDGTGNVLCIGPYGEMRRAIIIQPDNTIVSGCFHGTFDEFKSAVVEEYGEDYGPYSIGMAILRIEIKKRS